MGNPSNNVLAKTIGVLGGAATVLFIAVILRTWSMPTDIAVMASTLQSIQVQMESYDKRLRYVERLRDTERQYK